MLVIELQSKWSTDRGVPLTLDKLGKLKDEYSLVVSPMVDHVQKVITLKAFNRLTYPLSRLLCVKLYLTLGLLLSVFLRSGLSFERIILRVPIRLFVLQMVPQFPLLITDL